ncbi:MAG: alkaline phosphatase family protein [Solirubrobacteraceae bacterium]
MSEHHADSTSKPGLTRRRLLVSGANAIAGATLAGQIGSLPAWARPARASPDAQPSQAQALAVLGRSGLRHPDSLPATALAVGTDTLPAIEHVVVLMLENHSYDNFLGMLGRGASETVRGDGFTLASDGRPTASNPYPDGRPLRAFRMPTTCQPHGVPSQEWEQSHIQYAGGRNDGFVISNSGPVAMGYWTREDLPFTYDLATQFPIGDRWFASALAQTDPNRRFLIAATANGMTDDIGGSPGNLIPDASLGMPANGTIFERLTAAGISWVDYCFSFPTGATMELYPTNDGPYSATNVKSISQFYSDAAAGTLPSFSLLDPDYNTQSQEDPQNIVLGESLLAQVVHALGNSPAWPRTLLIVTYDEHGGYYDHVPPPPALAPDSIAPQVQPGESSYDGFARYGFRVPAVVVGPYAKPNHVSHVVYDHTSILAFIERKWNLPAMTYRDANANDLTDLLDLGALAAGTLTFPELPVLAASGETAATRACSTTGPGQIPPPRPSPGASPAPRRLPPIRVQLRNLGTPRPLHGLLLELRTTHGTLHELEVELHHRGHRVAHHHLAWLAHAERRVVLRLRRRAPAAGRYMIVVRHQHRTLLRRSIRVR